MKSYQYPRIPNESYEKAVGQARFEINKLLYGLFNRYGQDVEIKIASEVLMDILEQFGMRVRGKEQPIMLPPHIRKRIENEYNADD